MTAGRWSPPRREPARRGCRLPVLRYSLLSPLCWVLVLVLGFGLTGCSQEEPTVHTPPKRTDTNGMSASAEPARPTKANRRTRVEVAFDADCEALIGRELKKAQSEVLVAIYNITRRSITSALVAAHKRGVTVRVKYDVGSHEESQGTRAAIEYLTRNGVPCTGIRMQKNASMHDKFTVIDGTRVLTGSYNYTSAASKMNYENMVLIESSDVAAQFVAEFERIRDR